MSDRPPLLEEPFAQTLSGITRYYMMKKTWRFFSPIYNSTMNHGRCHAACWCLSPSRSWRCPPPLSGPSGTVGLEGSATGIVWLITLNLWLRMVILWFNHTSKYIYIYIYMYIYLYIHQKNIWVNCNNSLTWNKARSVASMSSRRAIPSRRGCGTNGEKNKVRPREHQNVQQRPSQANTKIKTRMQELQIIRVMSRIGSGSNIWYENKLCKRVTG